jgi:hypothetical protein
MEVAIDETGAMPGCDERGQPGDDLGPRLRTRDRGKVLIERHRRVLMHAEERIDQQSGTSPFPEREEEPRLQVKSRELLQGTGFALDA